MYFGKLVGGASDDVIFLCSSEFNNFVYAAVLTLSRATREVAGYRVIQGVNLARQLRLLGECRTRRISAECGECLLTFQVD